MCSGISTSRAAIDSRKVVCKRDVQFSVPPYPAIWDATHLSGTVLSKKTVSASTQVHEHVSCPSSRSSCTFSRRVPLAVVEREVGVLNQEATVEGERVGLDLDITTLGIRGENTVAGTIGLEAELSHSKVLLASSGGDVREGSVGR
jgi:hypothetical protein